jgi:hypothetical protein
MAAAVLQVLQGLRFPHPVILALGTQLYHAVDGSRALVLAGVMGADNRDWELRANELRQRFKQSRAIGE